MEPGGPWTVVAWTVEMTVIIVMRKDVHVSYGMHKTLVYILGFIAVF